MIRLFKRHASKIKKIIYLVIKYYKYRPYEFIYKKIKSDERITKPEIILSLYAIINNVKNEGKSIATACNEVAHFLLNCGYPEIAQTYYLLSLEKALLPSTYSLYLECLLVSP